MKKLLFSIFIALLLFGNNLLMTNSDLIMAGEDDLIDIHNYESKYYEVV